MARTENIDKCGCKLVRNDTGLHMENCPLHATASELLAACKGAMIDATGWEDGDTRDIFRARAVLRAIYRNMRAAIAKAEGN